MKRHTDYRIVFHGIESEQYFQGYGVSGSKFTDCATGIGASNKEALGNALDQLDQNGWDTEALEQEIVTRSLDGTPLRDKPDSLGEEQHYYVSIDVKGEDVDPTPWCLHCGPRSACDCGPIAENA